MAIILRWSGFLNMPRESAVSGAGAGLLASAVGTRPVAVTPQRKSPPLVVSWYVLLHGRHPIIRGRNRLSAGKKTRRASRMTSDHRQGRLPANITPVGTYRRRPLRTKTTRPTGG